MKAAVYASLLLSLCIFEQAHAEQEDQERQRRPQEQFRQVFSLPGVEWSEDQQEQVEHLREKYVPKLSDLQRRRSAIETPEQRRARQEAFRAARQAGKRGRELQAAVDESVPLTEEQKTEVDDLQRERRDLLAAIREELQSLLTAEQRAELRSELQRRNRPERDPATPPTHRDVQYGPHRRNVLDVWLAESDGPTPVLVSIHGGGFRAGNKSVDPELLRACLDSGISVVAITYRLSDEAIAPAQFLDAARAIQFVRHNAREWNLDPERIAATGGSAGAGLSLWLGFHDDLAAPGSDDPVLRQSTRLTCVSVYNGQTFYDPRLIRELFPGTDTYKHPALAQLYAVDLDELDDLPEEKYRLFEETSPITHLSRDDPPTLLSDATTMDTPVRSPDVGIHHPRFGALLDEKMEALGVECHVHTGVPRGDGEWTKLTMDFVKRHFGMSEE